MSKELEEAKLQVKEIISHKNDFDYAFGTKIQRPFTVSHEGLEAIETVLNYIENSIPKKKVEEKLIIDSDKLNHSTNGILSEMYKARITLAKELLEVE